MRTMWSKYKEPQSAEEFGKMIHVYPFRKSMSGGDRGVAGGFNNIP